MVVVRCRVQCQPDRTEEMAAAMGAVVAPGRGLPGVIHFDVARDVGDPNALIAIEVFEDRAAMEAQEAQAEVAAVMAVIETGALAAEPEWEVYEAVPAPPAPSAAG